MKNIKTKKAKKVAKPVAKKKVVAKKKTVAKKKALVFKDFGDWWAKVAQKMVDKIERDWLGDFVGQGDILYCDLDDVIMEAHEAAKRAKG
jgi:hypothetical protein